MLLYTIKRSARVGEGALLVVLVIFILCANDSVTLVW